MSREGEEIGKHKIAKVFRDRGSQTRLRSKSISGDAEFEFTFPIPSELKTRANVLS